MTRSTFDLPRNWELRELGEFCEIVMGQSPPGNTYNGLGEGLPFYQGKAEFGDVYPSPVKWCSAPTKIAMPEDILISVRAPVGPTNLCRERSCIGRGLAAIRPLGGVPSKYIFYGMRATVDQLVDKATGSTFAAVSGSSVRSHLIPLPPLPEQHRIVAEIETQLTRLDAAVAALERARANLKRYRAAVLKAACEGRLVPTEAELARKEGRGYESADVLLDRILAFRRARWQSRSQGRQTQKEYLDPSMAAGNSSESPEGWSTATLEQLTSPVRTITYGILKPGKNVPSGVLYIEVKDIKEMKVNVSRLHRTDPSIAAQFPRTTLAPGDLVLAVRGTYGRIAEVPSILDGGNVSRDVVRLDIVPEIDRRFISYQVSAPMIQNYFKRVARGVAVKGVNNADVKVTPISLPPLPEQHRIVAEVKRRLSVVDDMEKTVGRGLARAARLRQAILRKAFAGELVPQDPGDEPASVLLERIRSERAAASSTGKAARRGDRTNGRRTRAQLAMALDGAGE